MSILARNASIYYFWLSEQKIKFKYDTGVSTLQFENFRELLRIFEHF
jgi:hypothetical protein